MEKTKEINVTDDRDILIIDESGYDIEWFLCHCPSKVWGDDQSDSGTR